NYAVYYGHFDFVKFLLEHKADFTMQGQGGYTALMTAKAHDYKKIIKLLKDFGAKQ
ncbi:MAG TPA: ankyrin repeat domain-containing protein, partial [Saprospiraceae bacterium]|nr:ankyrin repeat domain-containing protein [Saprospiraceae bacterium]